ncbi:MAG: type II toxin-antitoxin system RelB/DinJ family antitoxin, partial [Cloacibacillus sp.]
MAKTETLHIRVEPEIKLQAEETFRDLGITTADAVNIFLHKAIYTGGFPFDVRKEYNRETIEAIKEAKRIARDPNVKTYSNFAEILKEIDDEIAAEE